MAIRRRATAIDVTVPGAAVRLVAMTTTVDVPFRGGHVTFARAGPQRVEMQDGNGRRTVARIHDFDGIARITIIAVGVLTVFRLAVLRRYS